MTRWTARLSLAAVAVIAAVASYLHALVVVQAADGHGLVSWFIPLLADLVIASSASNILDAGRTGDPRPAWSVASVGVGIAVTLGSNVMYGYPHAVPSWLVNGWPPVAFALTLESITGMVRRARVEAAKVAMFPDEPDEPPDMDADLIRFVDRHSYRKVAAVFGVHHGLVARRYATAQEALAPVSLNGHGSE